MYDLIKNIHAFASELNASLAKAAHKLIDDIWQHPECKLTFLWSSTGRRLKQIAILGIARTSVERKSTLDAMDNRKYNLVAAPRNPEQSSCRRTDENFKKHQAFQELLGEGSYLHRSIIKWFKDFLLCLDLPNPRVVRTCWLLRSLSVADQFSDNHKRLIPLICRAKSCMPVILSKPLSNV